MDVQLLEFANTWSEFNPCNAHFRDIAERVKERVYGFGGVPMEFPVFSNSESQLRPTAMLCKIWRQWMWKSRSVVYRWMA